MTIERYFTENSDGTIEFTPIAKDDARLTYIHLIEHLSNYREKIKEEQNLLAFAPILVTLEQAIRFFTDYLNGNIYYKVEFPNQNLDRGLNQITLAKKMLLKEKEMENYINSLFQS